MYIERDIEHELLCWKNEINHLALEVCGGRQVGKTTTILHFAKQNYSNVIYVNCADFGVVNTLEQICSNNFSTLDRVTLLCSALNLSFRNDSNTVLVFDEIQESKIAYGLIRPINRELSCDLIVTGSYLGKALEYFQPVGDVRKLEMFPITFAEFVSALNREQEYNAIPLDGTKIDAPWFEKAYKVYSVIGGYPYAVVSYLEGRDPRKAIGEIWNALLNEIRSRVNDIAVYQRIPVLVQAMLDAMVREKRGNSLQLEHLATDMLKYDKLASSKKEVFGAISWLLESHVISYCGRYDFSTGQLLGASRCFFDDVGLLRFLLEKYQFPFSAVEGLLSETFVYNSLQRIPNRLNSELLAFGILQSCEFDFTFQSSVDGARYTIEVKSGKGSNSNCRTLLDKGLTDYVINFKGNTHGGMSEDGRMLTLPLWLVDRFPFDLAGRVEKMDLQKLNLFE